ncbi:MAG: hypothetical protein M1445_04190 [Bacteroidetes bacterium]|nr:hypothetical protein [Bacteroidota bacterium]MCL6103633.1 hypothetical protein [Bacteroidota bacterium]
MELNEFKKAWQQVNADKIRSKELDVSNISEMLQRRGTGILSRLDRSVKIGIWFLVFFFLLTLADQFLPAELIFPDRWKTSLEVPQWICLLEWFVNFILMFSILIFVIRYKRLQVHSLADQDLQGAIKKVLKLLDTFKKEFYLALIILMSGICLGFLSGAQKGFESIQVSQAPTTSAIVVVALALLILLGLLIGSIFYIFHKGFNLLFGKYRDQLIQSLDELQENEE